MSPYDEEVVIDANAFQWVGIETGPKEKRGVLGFCEGPKKMNILPAHFQELVQHLRGAHLHPVIQQVEEKNYWTLHMQDLQGFKNAFPDVHVPTLHEIASTCTILPGVHQKKSGKEIEGVSVYSTDTETIRTLRRVLRFWEKPEDHIHTDDVFIDDVPFKRLRATHIGTSKDVLTMIPKDGWHHASCPLLASWHEYATCMRDFVWADLYDLDAQKLDGLAQKWRDQGYGLVGLTDHKESAQRASFFLTASGMHKHESDVRTQQPEVKSLSHKDAIYTVPVRHTPLVYKYFNLLFSDVQRITPTELSGIGILAAAGENPLRLARENRIEAKPREA